MTDIQGLSPDRFARVRDAFAANFNAGEELGARFAVCVEGEVVLDLYAGWADRQGTRPFGPDTLTPVFSTTKALGATLIARLVDEGRLDYDQPVADVWPEFAAAGKGAATVAQMLSHQCGLVGFAERIDPADWFDWDLTCARLAAMAPMWPIGSASGYHPSTWGFLGGEVFRRVDGRTMGTALREDWAEPFGLDLWIGLPDSEHGRVADMQRPKGLPNFGEASEPRRLAFGTPWSAPGGRGGADWRRAEFPAANGHATAPALARMLSVLACGGELDGRDMLLPTTIDAAAQERIHGDDLVLPNWMSWGAGFMRNEGRWMYGPGGRTFGHSGWGGSCAFADPEQRLSAAYVMNRQSTYLTDDPRPRRLIEALYDSL